MAEYKTFSKSVDKRAFRWSSRPRSSRIETEKGGKLGFDGPFDRPFDRLRAGPGQAQSEFSARFRDFEKAMGLNTPRLDKSASLM